MEKTSKRHSAGKIAICTSRWRAIPLLVLAVLLIPACVERMTLDQAKQVAVTMSEKESFTPPPRRIDDILTMLEAVGTPAKAPKGLEALEGSPPPQNADAEEIMDFYMKRGLAAWEVGKQDQTLEDLRMAYQMAVKADIRNEFLMIRLAKIERDYGNYRRALGLMEKVRTFSDSPMILDEVVTLYAAMGDGGSAKRAYDEAVVIFERSRQPSRPETAFHLAKMRGTIADVEGRYKEAEVHIRTAMAQLAKIPVASPVQKISHRLWLSRSLMAQERLLEAEFEVRQALKEALAHFGNTSIMTLRAVNSLIDVTLSQGRVSDAERLARAQIKLLNISAEPPNSVLLSIARTSLGNVLSAKREFTASLKEFDLARRGKEEFEAMKFSQRSLNMILALLMTGRAEEANSLVGRVLDLYRNRFGEDHLMTAEAMALSGLAEARTGKKKDAFLVLGKSIPVLIGSMTANGVDFSRTQRLRTIMEEYLGLLSEIPGEAQVMELGIDPVAEAFRIADALRSRSVQGALAASGARAAATDPNLSELIRKEQDLQSQIAATQQTLVDMLAATQEEQLPQLLGGLKTRIDTLAKSRSVILDEIKSGFPKYADFVSPKPPSLQEAAQLLQTGEALLSAYTAEEKTYIWLLQKSGPVRFAVSPLGRKDLQRRVTHLRKALDPKPRTLGDIPAFDLAEGYSLYERLLKPVEEGWKGSRELIVVTGGPLGQIPITVLPTSPSRPGRERGDMFSGYRDVPWMVREVAVSTIPSVSSFVNLRTLPQGASGRKPLIGFGDPLFNRTQASLAQNEKSNDGLASRGGRIGVRGIRKAEGVELDAYDKKSTRLESLSRLPDTAEELRGICEALGGDFADIFTGTKASERLVKTQNLSDWRVIAFATHALIPGDLDGLDQPALALSAPSVTGDEEDGLLTMSEVLKLKMNADWIVLSACNTGAAEGEGAEAVSGLGRAFFYAGARALLVSMWPVETSSARLLTTGLFRAQQEETRMTGSAALQKSILHLMDQQVLKDPDTGKTVAAYAHPIFWAPFVAVGETGRP